MDALPPVPAARRRPFPARRTVAPVGLGLLAVAGWFAFSGGPPPAPAADYDVAARRPETLAPGTVVGTGPPPGWSHLVIKGKPFLRPADRDKVNNLTARMAPWMFTVFAADVRPAAGGAGFQLRAVGLGLGAAAGGRDTVLTADTASKFGSDAGFVGREILRAGYDRQGTASIPARGPLFAVVDTPVFVRCSGKHQLARFRYALLADGATGDLCTLCWLLPPAGARCECAGEVARLAPNTLDAAELWVDANEIGLLGVPSEAAFAVSGLPPAAETWATPAGLRGLMGQTRFTPAEAGRLEAELRRLAGR